MLPAPTAQEAIEQTLRAASLTDSSVERVSLLTSVLGNLERDLAELIGKAYGKLDQSIVESYFADKGTHTSAAGSLFNARTVVSGLRAIPTAPLDGFLNDAGKEIPAS